MVKIYFWMAMTIFMVLLWLIAVYGLVKGTNNQFDVWGVWAAAIVCMNEWEGSINATR